MESRETRRGCSAGTSGEATRRQSSGGETHEPGRQEGALVRERKPYHVPAIVHTEKLEARAVVCTKATSSQCGELGGIVES